MISEGRSGKRCFGFVPAILILLAIGGSSCTMERPTGISARGTSMQRDVENPNSGAGDAKGYIHGWLNGQTVSLRYTRMYFCAEPPTSAVSTHCEVGAPPEVSPRSGPIPVIYALAPAGFTPDPSTIHCPAAASGTVCLNHPHALDASRVGLPDSISAPAHSHIITDTLAGWHLTVNIRVTDPVVWNEIAAAKSLAKVRELQAAGRLGSDRPTNVYFFFEVQGTNP